MAITDSAMRLVLPCISTMSASYVVEGAGPNDTTFSTTVTAMPYDGFGTLSLSLSWPAADVQAIGIVVTLLPTTRTARALDFTVAGTAGTASSTATNVATGYHTLSLKL